MTVAIRDVARKTVLAGVVLFSAIALQLTGPRAAEAVPVAVYSGPSIEIGVAFPLTGCLTSLRVLQPPANATTEIRACSAQGRTGVMLWYTGLALGEGYVEYAFTNEISPSELEVATRLTVIPDWFRPSGCVGRVEPELSACTNMLKIWKSSMRAYYRCPNLGKNRLAKSKKQFKRFRTRMTAAHRKLRSVREAGVTYYGYQFIFDYSVAALAANKRSDAKASIAQLRAMSPPVSATTNPIDWGNFERQIRTIEKLPWSAQGAISVCRSNRLAVPSLERILTN